MLKNQITEALGYLKTIAETLPKLIPVLQVDIEVGDDVLSSISPGSIVRTKATELERIAAALETIAERAEPIYLAPEGHVRIGDFPKGTNVVRCTMAAFEAMKDGRIEVSTLGGGDVELKIDIPEECDHDWMLSLQALPTHEICIKCGEQRDVADEQQGWSGACIMGHCNTCAKQTGCTHGCHDHEGVKS